MLLADIHFLRARSTSPAWSEASMRQKTCGHHPRAVEAAARDRDEKIRADLAVGFWFLVWPEFLWSYHKLPFDNQTAKIHEHPLKK